MFVTYALFNNYVYAFLLLDVVFTSRDLEIILKSVTDNLMQLYKTLCLGLIILYIFALYFYLIFQNVTLNLDNPDILDISTLNQVI
jgi:hypothetical protein